MRDLLVWGLFSLASLETLSGQTVRDAILSRGFIEVRPDLLYELPTGNSFGMSVKLSPSPYNHVAFMPPNGVALEGRYLMSSKISMAFPGIYSTTPPEVIADTLSKFGTGLDHELRHIWQARNIPTGMFTARSLMVEELVKNQLRSMYAPQVKGSFGIMGHGKGVNVQQIYESLPERMKDTVWRAMGQPAIYDGASLINEIDAYATADPNGSQILWLDIRERLAHASKNGQSRQLQPLLKRAQNLLHPETYPDLVTPSTRQGAMQWFRKYRGRVFR